MVIISYTVAITPQHEDCDVVICKFMRLLGKQLTLRECAIFNRFLLLSNKFFETSHRCD